jgi:hypothetical protein
MSAPPPGGNGRPATIFLLEALHHWAMRNYGQPAQQAQVNVLLADGKRATLDLPFSPQGLPSGDSGEFQVPGVPEAVPAPGAWPPPTGWGFQPGRFAYDGKAYPLSGRPLQILRLLAEAAGPITVDEIRRAIYAGYDADDTTITSQISRLRSILRELLELPADLNPVMASGDGGYTLNL